MKVQVFGVIKLCEDVAVRFDRLYDEIVLSMGLSKLREYSPSTITSYATVFFSSLFCHLLN